MVMPKILQMEKLENEPLEILKNDVWEVENLKIDTLFTYKSIDANTLKL